MIPPAALQRLHDQIKAALARAIDDGTLSLSRTVYLKIEKPLSPRKIYIEVGGFRRFGPYASSALPAALLHDLHAAQESRKQSHLSHGIASTLPPASPLAELLRSADEVPNQAAPAERGSQDGL